MKYAVRKRSSAESDSGTDPKPKKKKSAPVDQSNIPAEHKYMVQREEGDPEFKTQAEQDAYMYNKAQNMFSSEDIANRDLLLEKMRERGQLSGDPKKDMKMATEAYIVSKGGIKSEGVSYDDNSDSDSNPYDSNPLRGGNEREVRIGKRMNMQTTQGSGYNYGKGKPAKGSITRRRRA